MTQNVPQGAVSVGSFFRAVLVEIFGLDSVVGQKTEDAAVSLVRLKSHLMCKYGVRTLHADNVFR